MGQLVELSIISRRGEVERGFSMTLSRLFDPEDTGLMLSVASDPAGKPQAFVQWVPAPAGLVMADAEGITELPVLGRFLGRHAT